MTEHATLFETETLVIAGMDEVGRGSLAGPVVAAACLLTIPLYKRRHSTPRWSPFKKIPDEDVFIADSKLLTPEERERTFQWLKDHSVFGIGSVEASFIDQKGILAATQKAMAIALTELLSKTACDGVMVDGRDKFRFVIPHQSIVKGDQKEPCIAAASIIAKVTRDSFMRDQHRQYPLYGFAEHKGYGSELHLKMIEMHGPSPLHRRSFLKRFLDPAITQSPLSLFAETEER